MIGKLVGTALAAIAAGVVAGYVHDRLAEPVAPRPPTGDPSAEGLITCD